MPTLDLTAEELYVLRDDGVYKIPRAIHLGSLQGLANAVAQSAATHIPYAFVHDGEPTHLAVKGANQFLSTRLRSIHLRTFFEEAGNGLVLPVWEADDDALQMEYTWKLPADMHVTFGVVSTQNRNGDYRLEQANLFARKPGVGGFFKLPLPNTYDDTKLCLGDSSRELSAATLGGLLEATLGLFRAAPWNVDLRPEADELIRFNRDTGETVSNVDDWTEACARVSHPFCEIFTQGVPA